jgi:hypothetical protein
LASNAAEKPLTTRVYVYSGCTRTPSTASREISSFCDVNAAAVHRRSCSVVARPPTSASRSASAGAFSSTIIRWPTETRGRCSPASPCQRETDAVAAAFPP